MLTLEQRQQRWYLVKVEYRQARAEWREAGSPPGHEPFIVGLVVVRP